MLKVLSLSDSDDLSIHRLVCMQEQGRPGVVYISIFSQLELYGSEDARRHRIEEAAASCSGRVSPADDDVLDAYTLLNDMGLQSLAAAGLVLLLLYLTGRFLWLYNKDAAQAEAAAASASSPSSRRRRPATAAGASTTSLPAAASPPPRRAMPLSSSSSLLPVFFVLNVGVPAGPGAETAECAVCLTEFGEREAGRLLPGCGHAFHEQCIATWLRVSTTCPLCRAPVATK
ncbi:probable E3 ubiquitin-protein ligase ATL45 [Sorghum bicolor]|jgi:hypothetical protein|nr:probable E3 ubiquitin-protein ligase ATL45 [Sorghum bicolor]|eukprot:XP_002463384.2 probable E3 ubiquitin-protein ligase ATL45 [Sorghum bicolor]